MIRVKPCLAQISAYASPWHSLDRKQYLCLDQNESTQPLPSFVVDAVADYLRRTGVHTYPEYEQFNTKLSSYCNLPSDHLLTTNGSDRGIDIVLRTFLSPGNSMLIARPEFAMFGLTAAILDARVVGVPYETDFRFPYDAFSLAISGDIALIVAINPNNPTGTPIELDYLENLIRRHADIPILVDEAYYEYTGCTVMDLVPRYPNLIVMRTFSKAFAMAGLRLGYLAANPELIREFQKVRGPYDVNSLAIQAATAHIDHPEAHRANVAEVVTRSKPFIEGHLQSIGIVFYPGAGNFVLAEHPRRDELVAFLKSNGILVRPMHGPMLERTVRIGLGTLPEMQRVAEALSRFQEK